MHTHVWVWGKLDLDYKEDKYGNRTWFGAGLRYCAECYELEYVKATSGQTPSQEAQAAEIDAKEEARRIKQREANARSKARREAAAREKEEAEA